MPLNEETWVSSGIPEWYSVSSPLEERRTGHILGDG